MDRSTHRPPETPKQKLSSKPKSKLKSSIEKSAKRLKSKDLKYKMRSSKIESNVQKPKPSRNGIPSSKAGLNTFDNSKSTHIIQ
jgi:hypothetical protein